VEESVWVSAAMQRVFQTVEKVADADVPVLVRGESGVGKELVARAVHARSARASKALVKVNCAALPAELLESELFGHERGAFTGAHMEKPGKFELADGGTIFLDELGEMDVALQAKLLQVLQDGRHDRVGGKRSIRVDARVVVATNCDLEAAIEVGRFREDLYYRLNVVGIRVPPLRERREDIPPLVEHFARKYGRRYLGREASVDQALMGRFLTHHWPGNVRELENMVRRLVVLGEDGPVLEELDRRRRPDGGAPQGRNEYLGLKEIAKRAAVAAEREAIEEALRHTGWNRRKAAELLQVSYKALLYKIKETGVRDPRTAATARGEY
jgi:two-component system response regulator AtoC